jgi:glycosyltransferase involved in cell wall biosynthesis
VLSNWYERGVMRLYYDKEGIVRAASTTPIITNLYRHVDVPSPCPNPIGKKIVFGRPQDGLRLAVICNWGDACGIATYSKYLVDSLLPKVIDLRIFAEEVESDIEGDSYDVVRCWKRGHSTATLIKKVVDWKPNVVLIQHEFGIFPKAPYLLQMLQGLDAAHIPYVVTVHSVYEHLDKVVCTGAMKNVVVHSKTGEACMKRLGHTANICVIPHGCVQYDGVVENWNITHTPHAIMQFGFGFNYKGVDTALEAVAKLLREQPKKYGDIHYCYLCSESPHVKNVNNSYYQMLLRRIEELGLTDHAVIVRGFQTEDVLNQYLRTYKMAIFPYITDPKNVVYGASGAIRVAMANKIVTIASASHMFDDMEGTLPRPHGVDELAAAIDEGFSGGKEEKERRLAKASSYVEANSWPKIADRYIAFLRSCMDANLDNVIIV